MITLSSTQQKIVSFENGALLVEASAGSGKTRVLTERIKTLIQKTKRQILAITFTNKASEEIKERLAEVKDLDNKVFIGTFHSFCQSIIEMRCNALGYAEPPHVYADEIDRIKLIEKTIDSLPFLKDIYKAKSIVDREKFKKNILQTISSIKREMILDEDLVKYGISQSDIAIYLNYRDSMKSQNIIDYDDLLYLTYILFSTNPSIASIYRKNFEYICIDEAQDLNKAQYSVLRALTGDENKNVMLVGDPKQSIYGFNGSSSSFMDEWFVKDYAPTKIELKENYRSTKNILTFANKLMPNSTELDNIMLEGICETNNFSNPNEEANAVVDKIQLLLTSPTLKDIEGKLSENQIAVIARNKYVLSEVEKELRKRNIPYFYKNAIKGLVLSSNYGKIFDLALQVKINPKDSLHSSELCRLVASEDDKERTSLDNIIKNSYFKEFLSIVNDLLDDGSNFLKQIHLMQKYIKEHIDDKSKRLDDESNIALSDFEQIEFYWKKYEASNHSVSISQFRNYLALGRIVSLTEKKGVVLSTVHTMKGQEATVVFLIGMDDMTFPDYRAVQKGNNSFEMIQEKNDLYVAITRAKRYLFISYPNTRTSSWGNTYPREKSRLLPE